MYVRVNDRWIYTRDTGGSGRAVLLLHGWPDDGSMWRHQAEAMQEEGYRVIAPDLCGFGASTRPTGPEGHAIEAHVADMVALLDHLRVPRAHVLGHDWGARIAWSLASRHADRLHSVTGISPGYPSIVGDGGYEQMQKLWYMWLFQFRGTAEEWLLAGGLREMLAEHPDREVLLHRLQNRTALTASLGIYRATTPLEVMPREPVQFPAVSVPAMGICSGRDRLLDETGVIAARAHVSVTWRYEHIEGAGHWPQLQDPGRVNALILHFLSDLPVEAVHMARP